MEDLKKIVFTIILFLHVCNSSPVLINEPTNPPLPPPNLCPLPQQLGIAGNVIFTALGSNSHQIFCNILAEKVNSLETWLNTG